MKQHPSVAVLAIALAWGSAASAQSPGPSPSPAPTPPMPAVVPAGSAEPGGMTQGHVAPATVAGVLAPVDRTFARTALQTGSAELQAARLALRKGTSAHVRATARNVITGRTQANAVLVTLLKRKSQAAPSGVTASQRAALARLAPLNGAAFDRAYLAFQHREAAAMTRAMKAEMQNGKDADLIQFAKSVVTGHSPRA